MTDLFISAGELSGDSLGSHLLSELFSLHPHLKISAVAGPKMRSHPIDTPFRMEDLQVMGFSDVFFSLPKLAYHFYSIRNYILSTNPKAVLFIDYPGFHLRLQQHLRKKGYKGKLIHMPCPSVWAWNKHWIPKMAHALDLLLAFFPFEAAAFSHTSLPVKMIGHPITHPIANFISSPLFEGKKILALFPGSRKKEIAKNLPLQLKVARKLKALDPTLTLAISQAQDNLFPPPEDAILIPAEQRYDLMRSAHLALATSGTVTLELALHSTPTIVHFAIKPLDCFLAQKIFKINLPFYALPNLILQKELFPELFGPHFTEENLFEKAKTLWQDKTARNKTISLCQELSASLPKTNSSKTAAAAICDLILTGKNS